MDFNNTVAITENDRFCTRLGKRFGMWKLYLFQFVFSKIPFLRIPLLGYVFVNSKTIVDNMERDPYIVHGVFSSDGNTISRKFLEDNGLMYNFIMDYEKQDAFVNFIDDAHTTTEQHRPSRIHTHMNYALRTPNTERDLWPVIEWINGIRSIHDAQLALARRAATVFSDYEMPDSLVLIGDRMAKRFSFLQTDKDDAMVAKSEFVTWCRAAAEHVKKPWYAGDIYHATAIYLDSGRTPISTLVALKERLEAMNEPLYNKSRVEEIVTDTIMKTVTPFLFRHARENTYFGTNVVNKGDTIIYLMYLLRFHGDHIVSRRQKLRYCYLSCCGSSLFTYLLESCVLYSRYYHGPRPTKHVLDERIEVIHTDVQLKP